MKNFFLTLFSLYLFLLTGGAILSAEQGDISPDYKFIDVTPESSNELEDVSVPPVGKQNEVPETTTSSEVSTPVQPSVPASEDSRQPLQFDYDEGLTPPQAERTPTPQVENQKPPAVNQDEELPSSEVKQPLQFDYDEGLTPPQVEKTPTPQAENQKSPAAEQKQHSLLDNEEQPIPKEESVPSLQVEKQEAATQSQEPSVEEQKKEATPSAEKINKTPAFEYQGEPAPYVFTEEPTEENKEEKKEPIPTENTPFVPVPGGQQEEPKEGTPFIPVPGEEDAGPEGQRIGGAAKLYRLRIGDVLQISLYGDPETIRRVPVGPDGNISYLFVHSLDAWGKTVAQLRRDLEAELSSYYRDPIILMTPLEFIGDFYTILGEIRGPGLKAIEGEMTLLSAIAEAGGFRTRIFRDQTVDLIDLERSFVARDGECVDVDFKKLIDGDLTEDIGLRSGDYIYIAPHLRQEVHVLGEVGSVDTYEFFGTITLAEVIAEAGGVTGRASSRVAVIRGSLTNPTQYLIDFNRIVKGCADDFPLESGDIVYVAPRHFTTLREIVQAGVRDFVGTVASAAGTRAYIDINPRAAGVTAPQTSINFNAPTTPAAGP